MRRKLSSLAVRYLWSANWIDDPRSRQSANGPILLKNSDNVLCQQDLVMDEVLGAIMIPTIGLL